MVSKGVDHLVERAVTEPGDNFLLLDMRIKGVRLTLGSVCGPNGEDLPFFDNLKHAINSIHNEHIILGGDWNTTWDNSLVQLNIDVINMANIPSKKKSDKLRVMCEELNLQDPYRMFYPTRKEYTFIPSAIGMNNRSRLDFFIVSESILNIMINCTIPHSLSSTVFDHKPIFLSTKRKKIPHKQQINDVILDDPDLIYYVKSQVFESYIHHAILDNRLNQENKDELLLEIGRVSELLHRL